MSEISSGCEMSYIIAWGPGVTCGKTIRYLASWPNHPATRICADCASRLRTLDAPMVRLEMARPVERHAGTGDWA